MPAINHLSLVQDWQSELVGPSQVKQVVSHAAIIPQISHNDNIALRRGHYGILTADVCSYGVLEMLNGISRRSKLTVKP